MHTRRTLAARRTLRATIVGAGALGACMLFGACEAEVPPQPEIARPIRMLALTGPGSGETLQYSGEISTAGNVELGFEVEGKISEFPVREGQRAAKGDVLARLDPRDYQAKIEAALADTRASRAEYDRMKALFDEDVASEQQLDKARRDWEVSRSREKIAAKAVEDTTLRAPYDGIVSRKLAQDQQNVQAKQAVLVFDSPDQLEIIIDLPEQDFVQGRPGSTSEEITARTNPRVALSALPGREFPARIKEFATAADPVTRTFDVTLEFDAPGDVQISPGMTANVTITRPQQGDLSDGIWIPAAAVRSGDAGTPLVWVVDTDSMVVSEQSVEVGDLSGDRILVRSGLSPGDTVATSGVHHLRDGMSVRRFEN